MLTGSLMDREGASVAAHKNVGFAELVCDSLKGLLISHDSGLYQ